MCYLEVDCDKPNDPASFAPYLNLQVVEHRPMGFLPFDPDRVRLHLAPAQERDEFMSGHMLRQALRTMPVLNANYLDAWKRLLEDAESPAQVLRLFPERLRWSEKGWHLYTFFWGTVYKNSEGRLFVRYVCHVADKVSFGFVCLDTPHFRANFPAAVWS